MMIRSGQIRRGAVMTSVIVVIALLVLAVGGYYLLTGGGGSSAGATIDRSDIFLARRGSFDVTIPASGELNALRQSEISSQLEVRAVITEIIDEGVTVRKGDLLIRLDDEDIRNRIRDLRLDVDNAESRYIAAQASLRIRQESSTSELSLLDVDIRLARLTLEAWRMGEDVSRRQTLALDVETAEKDYERLVARYEASRELIEQEFISQDEFARDEIEMIRARSRREQAVLSLRVYEEFDSIKREAELESAVQKALDRRGETAERHATEITNLEREVANRLFALQTARESLQRAEAQLLSTEIYAPQGGLVVYASSLQSTGWGRGNDNPPPQVGTELRRNRTVLVIPDVSQMVAEVKVNEALSGRIRPGQRAVVYSDAIPDIALNGEVIGVGVLAETGNWRDPNRRDYTVRIRLETNGDVDLKPSMRCRAEIFVETVSDSVYIPVQAVFRSGGQAFVYKPEGNGFGQVPVRTGRASELYIEVREGVEPDDRVLLREPSAERIVRKLEEAPERQPEPAIIAEEGAGSVAARRRR